MIQLDLDPFPIVCWWKLVLVHGLPAERAYDALGARG